MGIEIEKKFTVKEISFDLDKYPFHEIEQGYLNVHPAIRVRRQDDIYYMTYKGTPDSSFTDSKSENIGQVEYNMPLDKASYEHMVSKADGNFIRKKRYLIPLNSDGFDEAFLSSNPDVREAVKEGSIKIELDMLIERLPDIYKDVLVMYYELDLSAKKIASVLGISYDTVLNRLERARNLLRKEYLEED